MVLLTLKLYYEWPLICVHALDLKKDGGLATDDTFPLLFSCPTKCYRDVCVFFILFYYEVFRWISMEGDFCKDFDYCLVIYTLGIERKYQK